MSSSAVLRFGGLYSGQAAGVLGLHEIKQLFCCSLICRHSVAFREVNVRLLQLLLRMLASAPKVYVDSTYTIVVLLLKADAPVDDEQCLESIQCSVQQRDVTTAGERAA